MSRASDDLTPEQWGYVEAAVPAARALARSVARRCHNHTVGELGTLAEDSLRRRVRKLDTTKGKDLMAFAGQMVRLDLIRAANRRAHDPCVAAGLGAFDRQEEAIEVPDLETRFAETGDEKDARARAQGDHLMAAAYYAHAVAHAAQAPDEALAARHEVRELRRIAEATEPGSAVLLDLVFVQEATWQEAADQLGLDLKQAQRIVEKVVTRLRRLRELRASPASDGGGTPGKRRDDGS